jgi:LysR family glycine cleavage system transcriptional activator
MPGNRANLPLAGLYAFHAVAHRGRFRAAADDLGITESAISHRIRRLEDFLGIALFDRSGPSVRLTAAGRRYFEAIDPPLTQIREATGDLTGPANTARVTLTIPPSLATLWLIPNMISFEQHCPGISLQLVTTAALHDLRRDQIDLAIRHGMGDWPAVRSTFLLAEKHFPVCRADYLEASLASDPAEALKTARLIVNDMHPHEWIEWTGASSLAPPPVTNTVVLNGQEQVLEAAERGLGIAIGRRPLVDERLKRCDLVKAFSGAVATGAAYYLCHSEGVQPTAAARRVIRWLKDIAADRAMSSEARNTGP